MTNYTVYRAFASGGAAAAPRVWVKALGPVLVLYSYATPVAVRVPGEAPRVVFGAHEHSATTRQHMRQARAACEAEGLVPEVLPQPAFLELLAQHGLRDHEVGRA